MPNFNSSPNMGLPIPAVGIDPGPDWAVNLNNSLTIVDSHDHSAGEGVQITPAGLNISSDLPIQGNNLTLVRSTRYSPQGAPLSLPADVACVFVSGADLYYNDTSGNHVRITQGGAVVGTPGSITGLVSPASASYNPGSGTFIFQQAVNTAANMDVASVIFRDPTAGSHGVTVSAPSGLGVDETITLPLLPSVRSYLAIDSSGNMSTAQPVAPNIFTSSSSGAFFVTSVYPTFADVTNLSVTIITTGRPVYLALQSDGVSQSSASGLQMNVNNILFISLLRDSSVILTIQAAGISNTGGTAVDTVVPPPFLMIDVPSAGTHTYDIQAAYTAAAGAIGTPIVKYNVLVAYEI